MNKYIRMKSTGIPDDEFIRGNVPMTKSEVRSVILSKLQILEGNKVCDIGAGSGSLSVELGKLASKGRVYSLEKNLEALELIKKNIRKFKIENIKLIEGEAPEALGEIPQVDRVFIGGSGGYMKEIIQWSYETVKSGGIVAASTITIENNYTALKSFESMGFKNIEVVQISVSKSSRVGRVNMLKALNPINIISAER
ncbi:MAG: precorrin-6Y C5,15-methyltransferase (decarboxylating) subunit CbiT [Bacillota bacterium]|nr:precorrin-6Y C5,15-methyltransferase (decarboxylating) subunit CbiT [Bacillota bacterium]